jgi:hypothetical protein
MCFTYAAGPRFTNKLWQDYGIAGTGEFLLDMAHFLNDNTYRNVAFYQSESLLIHKIPRPKGIAFPGLDFVRLCCDYGRGSAGIGMFVDRLLGDKPRFLMLDHLFDNNR